MSTVLVTGANRGIGLALVRQLVSRPTERYPLIVGLSRGRSDAALDDIVAKNPGRVHKALNRDPGDPESIEECVQQIRSIAPDEINVLVNNAGDVSKINRLPAFEAAVDLRNKLLVNTAGPVLLTCGLHTANLLVAPHNAPPPTLNFPTTDLSSISSTMSESPFSHVTYTPKSPPTTAPHCEPKSELANVPIVMNIWSTQGSMQWAGEMWEGGSTRDELVFHPVYAASKAALSAVSMHLAREMRNEAIINCVHPGWVRTEVARKNAPLAPEEAADKLIKLFESWKTTRDSGQWLNEEGQKVPW